MNQTNTKQGQQSHLRTDIISAFVFYIVVLHSETTGGEGPQ
jgi:hypothetical protein